MKIYSLKEISEWQKEVSGKETKIFLPSLQRGFVWKPFQIEALWDSIFRGYPIGAILMSIDKENNRNLLDGQQRCTTIALGHFNPFDNNTSSYLSLKTYKPSIWIDLAPRQKVNGQKFIFRCLTQSHPWGYQLRDSNTTLSMPDRRNALDFFMGRMNPNEEKTERYTDLKSRHINPWDSYFPIPLSYILDIEATDETIFKNIILSKLDKLKIKTKYSNDEFVNYNEIKDSELSSIYKGYCNYKKLLIPEIIVDSNVLKDDEENSTENSEDPTLFVRLNSAGTRISGEELNYSIHKAYFPDIKDLVETIGGSYIVPSKVISIFSRLSSSQEDNFNHYQKEFSIQIFRKKIADTDFRKILQENIKLHAQDLINEAIDILKNNDTEFPIILLKQLIVSNTDLFFILLSYIKKNGYKNLNQIEKNDIASCYVYILWFSKDSKKVSNELFRLLFIEESSNTWNRALEKLIKQNYVIPIVKPNILRQHLVSIVINNKIDTDNIEEIKKRNLFSDDLLNILNSNNDIDVTYENWNLLINRIYWNKSFLLYVQKQYLNTKFKEFNQFESIADTNRPWDWDHIYPNSWVYHKEGINHLVKSWVNSIGNYRALSYDDNRSESNTNSPKVRFENDDKKTESFVNDNDFIFWNQIDNSFWRVKEDEKQVTIFLSAVIHRMANIYEYWFENYLNINNRF